METNTPFGYCKCGCGEKTAVAPRTINSIGWKKGQPKSYIINHHRRMSGVEYIELDAGYSTPCWVWQRGKDNTGYGQMWRNGHHIQAHRVFYERAKGPIPAGLQVDHLCRNRSCVNPDHLEAVTNAQNTQRGVRAKLSMGAAGDIRKEYAAGGETLKGLARRYQVSPAAIRQVLTGKCWKEHPPALK